MFKAVHFAGYEDLAESVPELRVAAVNAWAINQFNCRLDRCALWLTDSEATEVAETLDSNLYGLGFKV